MSVTIDGTTGITNDGGYTGDGVVFADTTPANTLVTTTGGNVGIGTSSPLTKLTVSTAATTDAVRWTDNINSTGILSTASGLSTIWTTTALGFGTGAGTYTERMRIDSSGNLLFNSGYGSVATAYGCRAWVNFNGTGTVAIRASGNVSSITDNGTGDYTVNFTTAMPDENYSFVATSGSGGWVTRIASMAMGNCNIQTIVGNTTTATDTSFVQCAIFH
jgi:hypothetical protein